MSWHKSPTRPTNGIPRPDVKWAVPETLGELSLWSGSTPLAVQNRQIHKIGVLASEHGMIHSLESASSC